MARSIFSWLTGSRASRQDRRRRDTRRSFLRFESLESRAVPAVLTVTSLADNVANDGEVTLREAIVAANAHADADTIDFRTSLFADGPQKIDLTGALPELSSNITITGPEADQLTVRRDTGGNYRIFTVTSGALVSLSGLTVSNGNGGVGGGIQNVGGVLTLTNCTVTGNTADQGNGGGIQNAYGVLTLTNCTVTGNTVRDGFGSGVAHGGGIANHGVLTLTNCTVTGNTAAAFGGGIYGGGTLTNTIVAGNTASRGAPDISGTVASDSANNLIGDPNSSGGLTHGITGNIVGQDNGAGGRKLLDITTVLAPLDDNSGPTMTHALVAGSPAIDAGSYAALLGTAEVQSVTVTGGSGTFTLSFAGEMTQSLDTQSRTLDADLEAALNELSSIGGVGGSATVARFVGTFFVQFGGSLAGTNVPELTSSPTTGITVAINTITEGNAATIITTDQRGFARISGGTVDIGAFEFQNQAPTVSFSPAVNYSTGDPAQWVAVGDFNNDSELDLAVAVATTVGIGTQGEVSVLLGKGIGTFQEAVKYGPVGAPNDLAVGDFNGDGKLDLNVKIVSSGFPQTLVGNGDGTFQAPVLTSNRGELPRSAEGDFNGDGILDVANPNGSNAVEVLLGKADGTFEDSVAYGAGTTPGFAAAADFNGDGKLDLVVANHDSDNVSVLIGNSDGTFQDAVTFGVGDGPRNVAMGDVNGDHRPDLVVANFNSGTVSVLLNTTTFPNSAPTGIILHDRSVDENEQEGTAVGSFSTTDPDAADTFMYELVSGDGDTDNDSFTIDDAGNLRTSELFDFEDQPTYLVRVRSTDAGGLSVEREFAINVANVNEAPTLSVPADQIAFEDVDHVITGISVSDPEEDILKVTLHVCHGTLTLGSTESLISVTGNASGAVTLSGSSADLNDALDSLVYRGSLNYSGADKLTITVSDAGSSDDSDQEDEYDAIGSGTKISAEVAICVQSWAKQVEYLSGLVDRLVADGVINAGQGNALKLNLKGNNGDAGKVQAFLNQVNAFVLQGILDEDEAKALLGLGNTLLKGATRR